MNYRKKAILMVVALFCLNIAMLGLSLKPWGIALKFLFLHHENILFPND